MRKLASVRRISSLSPIPGADRIEVAAVDGWEVVVAKSMGWSVGDLCIYFEIDSWIPNSLAPFLTSEGKEPRVFNGVKGERLRTVKLRGQVSQGLILPMPTNRGWGEGKDLTDILGIHKWEREVKESSQFKPAAGSFPTNLFPKTDEERIQNMFNKLDPNNRYEKTLKLDGSSCSVFSLNGNVRVCSRNLELKVYKPLEFWGRVKKFFGLEVKQEVMGNNWSRVADQKAAKLKSMDGLVFQGEIMGPGIQGNREGFTEVKFFCYNIYDIRSKSYLLPADRRSVCDSLGIDHVPVLDTKYDVPGTLKEVLAEADALSSINHPIAEGFVCKPIRGGKSFKVISNKYLLKEE